MLQLVPKTAVNTSGEQISVTKESLHRFFYQVDPSILTEFGDYSIPTGKTVVAYDLIEKKKSEPEIIGEIRVSGKFTRLSIADVCNITREHLIGGRKLLKDNGISNIFFLRNKDDKGCQVSVFSTNSGFAINYHGPVLSKEGKEKIQSVMWPRGRRIFGKP